MTAKRKTENLAKSRRLPTERRTTSQSRGSAVTQPLLHVYLPVLQGQSRTQQLPLAPVLDLQRVVAQVEEKVDDLDEIAERKPGHSRLVAYIMADWRMVPRDS